MVNDNWMVSIFYNRDNHVINNKNQRVTIIVKEEEKITGD